MYSTLNAAVSFDIQVDRPSSKRPWPFVDHKRFKNRLDSENNKKTEVLPVFKYTDI